ncbi:MAG: MarR family winged helix-turn-helix transcriptional regulator [Bacillota bacterium]|jgi:DNA-binding MarR family transcriptional regulator
MRNGVPETAPLDELIVSIGRRLLYYFSSRNEELSLKEIFVIEMLSRQGMASMSELAASLGVPFTTMASMVQRMVNKGYLQKEQSPEDRRVMMISLTPTGRQTSEQHREGLVSVVKELLATLDDTDQSRLMTLINEVLILAPVNVAQSSGISLK